MNRKLKTTLLASTIALVLAGCSSDDTETTDNPVTQTPNSTPVLTIVGTGSLEIEENSTGVIEYNLADNDNTESELTLEYEVVGLTDTDVSVTLNEADKSISVNAGNVQENVSFSVTLTVTDPEGAEVTQTLSVNVLNTQNETPEPSFAGFSIDDGVVNVQVSGTNNPESDMHTVEIPYGVSDNDGDELNVSVTALTGGLGSPVIELREDDQDSGIIALSFSKIYQVSSPTDNVGNFIFTADDQNQPLSVQFNVVVGVTQVSPELEINKNEVSGGVVPFEVDEDQSISITFTSTDLNGDQVFVTGELSNPEVVPDFNSNITGNSISLSNFNVSEDILLTLTLTATDNTGTPVATDVVQIDIRGTINQSLDQMNIEFEEEKVKFLSMQSRDPELTLFGFYSDYLSLTSQLTDAQKTTFETQLTTGRATEIDTAEVLIAEIENERAKSEDEIDLALLATKIEELKVANNAIGQSGIEVLNVLAEMDSNLLTIDLVDTIYKASDESYSRYVGNLEIGFYSNEFTWEFLSAYDLLENINFQTGECN